MLEFVLEGFEVGLFLVLGLGLVGTGVQSVHEGLSVSVDMGGRRIFLITFFAFLVFSDFFIDFVLDLLQLLSLLLVQVRQDEESLSLVLQLSRVVVGFLLESHGLRLVQAVTGGHKFIVRCHPLIKCLFSFQVSLLGKVSVTIKLLLTLTFLTENGKF